MDLLIAAKVRRPAPWARPSVGVSLQVDRGQIVGLVGESGSGKSSPGSAAIGVYRPSSDKVLFNGELARAASRVLLYAAATLAIRGSHSGRRRCCR